MSQILKPKKGYKKVKGLFGKYEQIPVEWEITELQHHAELYVPMRDKPKKFDGDIPWLRIEDLDDKYASDSKSNQRVSLETIKEMKLRVYPIGTVLCSCSATIGVCAITTQKLTTNQTFIGITPNDSLDNQFLYYFLTTQKNYLNSVGSGSTILYISRAKFEKMKIILPPLKEQQKVATILSNIDNLITNTQKVIDQTNSIKNALMKKLLLRGIAHKKFKKISLGIYSQHIIIPEEWNADVLQKFSEHITKGATPTTYGFEWSKDPTDILFIRNECIKQNKFNLKGSLYITEKANDFLKRSQIISGDLLISITGEIGKTCIFPSNYVQANINQHIAKVRINSKQIHTIFVSYLLNTNYYVNYFNSINQGLTHPHLSLEQIQKTIIPIPPIQEQQKIASILSNIDFQITSQTQYKEKLEKLKKSLMQKLLTGQVRVAV